ncbi:MAG: glycoside hydrolase family 30 beta sandwich domain-containing protein [Bacteroidales bacterium]|jgi:O-glycosyl hydrolase
MKLSLNNLLTLILFIHLSVGCKKIGKEDPLSNPAAELAKINITIDKSVNYQTIDGFGFFGAYDVWWAAQNLWNDAWGDKIINDLGITIWRNEWYPPATPDASQDADWYKQEPVVQAIKAKADLYGVNLKFIVSIWSPPADMKWLCNFSWAGDPDATRNAGQVSTKNGGTLNPGKYTDYADWLKSCIQSYKDAGSDLYALSLQNEPLFSEPYNSCTYTTQWYCDLLNNVVPLIKSSYPDVKIFGSENMLEMEGKSDNWPYFYHQAIKNNATAKDNIDILAVHGYSDGISATSGSELARMWTYHAEQFSTPLNKPAWMTETSGYSDSWISSGTTPGALNLAMDIYSGLNYGNMQAWVWWQGSEASGISNYSLMSNNTCGKKYYVSKHYYRFIRPGAIRVKSTSDDPEVFVTAFNHQEKGTTTIVIINDGSEAKSVSVLGDDLPAVFTIYLTTSGSENCKEAGTLNPGQDNQFELPAKSIVTLQAGGDPL